MKRSCAPSNTPVAKRLKTEEGIDRNALLKLLKNPANDNSENEENGQEMEVENGERKNPPNIPLEIGQEPIFFRIRFRPLSQSSNEGRKRDKKEKKNPNEEQDGLLEVSYDTCIIHDNCGKQLTKGITLKRVNSDDGKKQKVYIKSKEVFLNEGGRETISNRFIYIFEQVSAESVKTGDFFLQTPEERIKSIAETKKTPTIRVCGGLTKPSGNGFQAPRKKSEVIQDGQPRRDKSQPLHSPFTPDAVVLFTPKDIFGKNRVHVVVDPILAKCLRPHQVEGVKFLFDCVGMGFTDPVTKQTYYGAILADDMGLGKTIQAISLMWTLLRQGPTGDPIAKRAVIVCPSSLCGNWKNEFEKWLPGKVKIILIEESNKAIAKIGAFEKEHDILVISYDQLKIHIETLKTVKSIGLVVCDEGHRLKNDKIKTSQAVAALPCKRRIILSGTPIQNDLNEFFAMVNFVNPGLLGDSKKFFHIYGDTIMKGRDSADNEGTKEKGLFRSKLLTEKTKRFILRRTQVINRKYLPPKLEHTVFFKFSPLQKSLYKAFCDYYNSKLTDDGKMEALPLITNLKKLCNTPELLHQLLEKKDDGLPSHIAKLFPPDFKKNGIVDITHSTKMHFLDNLLKLIRTTTKDKIVIVSNYTETLEILANLCKQRGYAFFQLDGQTTVKKRQKLVDLFNVPEAKEFVFLLSSKAGGVGLNLIGANHLILFDPDWNPANDDQAMARVWRPGQKKKCFLYRFLCTGSIEEKVYQRQVTKKALSKNIVEGDAEAQPTFSTKELRDLFKLREDTVSDTHDLLNCACSLKAVKIPRHKRMQLSVDDLNNWEHFDKIEQIKDELVKKAAEDLISFLFSKESGEIQEEKEINKELGEEEGDGDTTYQMNEDFSNDEDYSPSKKESNEEEEEEEAKAEE